MKQKPSPSIYQLFFHIIKSVRIDLDRWLRKTNAGITAPQFGLLRAIGHAKHPLSFNELARHMTLRPPSILPSVDSLEKEGYLRRHENPEDRRKIELIITAKGKKLLARVMGSGHTDSLRRALKKMGASKEKQLVGLLEELVGKIHN